MLQRILFAIALLGCGGKKAERAPEPTSAPAPAETAPTPAEGLPATAGSGAPTCESEGGKCINKAAAVTCGTKSHDGGCPTPGPAYCCIR